MWMINVMIVDDEPPIAEMVRKMVENAGNFCVTGVAHDAEEGLRLYKQLRPDILLCDILMPGKTGLELMEEIRELSHSCHVVIISGHSDFEYARTALKLNVNEYLLKPVRQADLEKTLTEISQEISKEWNRESPVFDGEGLKNLLEERELLVELYPLCTSIQAENFAQIKQIVSLLTGKMKSRNASEETVSRIVVYLGKLFAIEIAPLLLCKTYGELQKQLLLEIKKAENMHTELSAFELVDLLEYRIRTDMKARVSGKELFQEYGYNDVYLINLFRQYKGLTPHQFQQKVRMEKAMELIRETPEVRIKTVTEMVGYSDQLYFSKLFRDYTGMSPSEYARKQG